MGQTTASWGSTAFSINVIDYRVADVSFSGQNRYQRTWLRISGGDLLVASFNTGSGAYISAQFGAFMGGNSSGAVYERHDLLSPTDKDAAIDYMVKSLRVRREVAIPSTDGAHLYAIDAAASPNSITSVLEVYYFAATGTLSRDVRGFADWEVVPTATGTELRIEPALGASMQIVLMADLALTLGGDTATLNLPDEKWFLSGVAAKCFDLLIQKAPGQSAGLYEKRRREFAQTYSRLSNVYGPANVSSVEGLIEEIDSAF